MWDDKISEMRCGITGSEEEEEEEEEDGNKQKKEQPEFQVDRGGRQIRFFFA